MTERSGLQQFGRITQKWRDLAEQRREYFAELYCSGRWKLYYTEEEFLVRMRDIVDICERWAKIASLHSQPESPEPIAPVERRNVA